MTTEQDKQSREVIERLARGEEVEWQFVNSNAGNWFRADQNYDLNFACRAFSNGTALRILEQDLHAYWKEKQKRGEKFEYRTWGSWEDGSKCMFLPEIKYEFRDFIRHREWKEKFDNGVKLQYRRPWMKSGFWMELTSWEQWCSQNDVEFREAPVKEPFPLGPEDVMPGDIVRPKANYRNDRYLITSVNDLGVSIAGLDYEYNQLKAGWERLVNNQWLPWSK